MNLKDQHDSGECPDHCGYCKIEQKEINAALNPTHHIISNVSNPCKACNSQIQSHLIALNEQFCLDCREVHVLNPKKRELEQILLYYSQKSAEYEDLCKLQELPLDPKVFYQSPYFRCQIPGCSFQSTEAIQRDMHIRDTGHSFDPQKQSIQRETKTTSIKENYRSV